MGLHPTPSAHGAYTKSTSVSPSAAAFVSHLYRTQYCTQKGNWRLFQEELHHTTANMQQTRDDVFTHPPPPGLRPNLHRPRLHSLEVVILREDEPRYACRRGIQQRRVGVNRRDRPHALVHYGVPDVDPRVRATHHIHKHLVHALAAAPQNSASAKENTKQTKKVLTFSWPRRKKKN